MVFVQLDFFKKALPFALGIGLLALVVSKVGAGEVLYAVSRADAGMLAFAAIAMAFNLQLRALRWTLSLGKLVRLRLRHSSMVYYAGQIVNEVLPVGSGEFARAQFVKRLSSTSRAKVLAPLMLERTTDVFVLLVFSATGVGLLQGGHPLLLAGIAAIIAFMLLVLVRPQVALSAFALFSFAAVGPLKKYYGKAASTLGSFSESLSLYSRDRKLLSTLLALSAVIWFGDASILLLAAKSVGVEIPLLLFVPIAAISWLVGAFSFLPGGIGARDAAFAVLLASAGYSFSSAITISLLYRGMVYLVLGSAGVASFVMLGSAPQHGGGKGGA
ncbi:MAG: lysylphosphatidylglycerol synthase transmembrane domain-containing protein [Candidatus Micrarchaeota archaeon]